jgi:hypothetical protein
MSSRVEPRGQKPRCEEPVEPRILNWLAEPSKPPGTIEIADSYASLRNRGCRRSPAPHSKAQSSKKPRITRSLWSLRVQSVTVGRMGPAERTPAETAAFWPRGRQATQFAESQISRCSVECDSQLDKFVTESSPTCPLVLAKPLAQSACWGAISWPSLASLLGSFETRWTAELPSQGQLRRSPKTLERYPHTWGSATHRHQRYSLGQRIAI